MDQQPQNIQRGKRNDVQYIHVLKGFLLKALYQLSMGSCACSWTLTQSRMETDDQRGALVDFSGHTCHSSSISIKDLLTCTNFKMFPIYFKSIISSQNKAYSISIT